MPTFEKLVLRPFHSIKKVEMKKIPVQIKNKQTAVKKFIKWK